MISFIRLRDKARNIILYRLFFTLQRGPLLRFFSVLTTNPLSLNSPEGNDESVKNIEAIWDITNETEGDQFKHHFQGKQGRKY